MKNSMKKLALVAATSALLFACHGNDGSSTPTAAKKSVSGKLIDGPIKGMDVCADTNKDGDCANEPKAVSGDDGSFVINDIPADTNLTSLPLVATAGDDAVDTVTGKKLKGLVLEVLLVTQEDPAKEVIMTPLKKLVADKLKASINDNKEPKLDDALTAVAQETGLSKEELLANPAAANASEKVKKAAQIVAGILIKSQEKLDAAKAKIDSKNLSGAQEAKADEKVEEKTAENALEAAKKALKDLKDDTNVEEAINDVEVEAISDKEIEEVVSETSGAAQA